MKIIQDIRLYLVIVTLSFLGLLVNYLNVKEELEKCKIGDNFIQGGDIAKAQLIDSLQRKCDSLHWELFPTQVELGRYEMAFEILKERNPKAAEEYGTIISEETE